MLLATAVGAGCTTAIPFDDQPAQDYVYGSAEPLRVSFLDQTGDAAWAPSIAAAQQLFAASSPLLQFGADPAPNIAIVVYRYSDASPPVLEGYRFQPGVAGFAAVYDGEGRACNFPPSPLPLNCDGAIARAEIYLNDAIPQGADLEGRRLRLVMHELGHALGLTRHAATVDADALAARYGW